MLIAFLVVLGIFLFTAFMLLVVHPLACIVECAMSKQLSGVQKALWIAVTFFTGFFGAFVYALVGTSSKRLRSVTLKATAFCVVMGVASAGMTFVTPSPMEAMKMASEEDKAKFAAAFDALESLDNLQVNESTEAFVKAKEQVEKDLAEWGFADGETTVDSDVDFGSTEDSSDFSLAEENLEEAAEGLAADVLAEEPETPFFTSTEGAEDVLPSEADDLANEFFGEEMEFDTIQANESSAKVSKDSEPSRESPFEAEFAEEDLEERTVDQPVALPPQSQDARPAIQQEEVAKKPKVINRYRSLPSYVPFQVQKPEKRVRNRYTGE